MRRNLRPKNQITRVKRNSQILNPGALFPLHQEYKYATSILTADFSGISNVCSYRDITATILQGLDTYRHRIGDVITTKHLTLTGTLCGAQAGAITDDVRNTVRIVAFWGTPGLVPNFSVGSLFGPDFFPGIRTVIYDKIFSLVTPGKDTVGYLPSQKVVSFVLPIPNSVRYFGTGTNTTTSDSLFLCMVSDSGAITHPGFTSGQAMVTYLDH